MSNYYDLVDELNKASEAYYNGQEIMSNFEYDSKYDMLKRIESESGVVADNSPTKHVGAPVKGDLPKFTHEYPALSLDKTKDAAELKRRFEDGILESGEANKDGVVVMWKLDGSTVQAYYRNGRLHNLVTRGNGEIGSDITHNAKAINGVPLTIPIDGEVVVRGEALMSYEDFNRINEALPADQQYKNPRNLAAASISLLDPKETKERHIAVKMFNLVYCSLIDNPLIDVNESVVDNNIKQEILQWSPQSSFAGRLHFMRYLGFDVVERCVCSVTDLAQALHDMSDLVNAYEYPVDGLVIAMDNHKYAKTLQGTGHHPNIMQGYAFKWSDEVAETTIRNIEWSPSRTGLLNPVAIFDPVELEGTTVQRASLHNVSEMYRILGPAPFIGERIEVMKSNKIIPIVIRGYWDE